MWIPLTTERAQYQSPFPRRLGSGDGFSSQGVHLFMVVALSRELSRIGIITVCWDRRVMYHCALQMKPPVSKVKYDIHSICRCESGGCAPKNFSFTQRGNLRNENIVACFLQRRSNSM